MNCRPLLTVFPLLLFISLHAQNARTVYEKCGTMQYLEKKLEQNANSRERFEQKRIEFNRVVSTRTVNQTARLTSTVYIPIVFHIVMPDPNVVTDAQIRAQLDTLNEDYFGINGDSVKIPSYFKPLFGKSNIQFCLAQRTPEGDSTNGIERVTTSKTSFGFDDGVKHVFSGGADAWNSDNYFNVWVCTLGNNVLGFGTFPDDPNTAAADQGVVVDYHSLPGGSTTGFSGGKTLTHETGHYFNLYHIWGDDGGSCTGTDYVDDTPNQGNSTSGCPSGVVTDNCTQTGNGIMYENYMDYSDDPCLVMFTLGQVDRMETALTLYRPSLLSSNGCQHVVLNNYDAQLRAVNQPAQRLCNAVFAPQVTIRNRGSQVLTSVLINTQIDNGPVTTFPWTGSISTYNTALVTLNNLTATPGFHTLTVFVSNPDGNGDADPSNDTLRLGFQYATTVTTLNEGFEETAFPPVGWDIVNNDNSITWQRVTGVSKSGIASVMIDNFNYDHVGATDDLRSPSIKIPAVTDTAFLSFQVAAATYTDLTNPNNNWDTLEVLASTDCGKTYTSLYKKWAKTLVTTTVPTSVDFVPGPGDWRKDSIDLAGFIGSNDLIITFRNTTGFENNIYLDDINLRTVVVNPNLKAQGFLVTPNPTYGMVAVQFDPQPVNLKGIQLFNDIGQKIAEVT
ncbi:MAG: M43 family zinc metalloprotease, partial [Flavisolibacter sp.]